MIERLHECLHALHAVAPGDLACAAARELRAACADALRLQLDCMQQELGATERQVLAHLDDMLEMPDAGMDEIASAVAAALQVVEPRWPERVHLTTDE